MEILVEILLEVYMELMLLFVPEKNVTKKHRTVALILAIAELAVLFLLVIWGVSLILDQGSMLGIIPLAIVLAISVAQIVFGVVHYKKRH